MTLFLLGIMPQAAVAERSAEDATGARIDVVGRDCDEGLQAIVESQILKTSTAIITRKDPTLRMTLACFWQLSPPGSTSFSSSWGNADLTVKVEDIEKESTVYADSFSAGAKSRGLAMKKAAAAAIRALLKSKVLPAK